MMVLAETDERRAFVEAIGDFARRRCGNREQRDALTDHGNEAHNPELFRAMADLGWIGATVPEEYGGAGGTVIDGCLLLEAAEYGRIPVFALTVSVIVAKAVETFGSDAQKRDVLASLCAGTPKSIAMSEPEAGSDVGSLRTRAVKDNGGWRLNGQKTWITGAQFADTILVVCRTDLDAAKHDGISMFLVPSDAAGVEVRPIPTMGPREVNDVFLTDVELPGDALLGQLNGGWRQLMAGLNFERLIAAAWMLGLARRAFDDTLEYVKQRRQFGRPIGSFQTIKHRLADLATEIECTRLLIYDVARRAEEQPEHQLPREASMAKLKASEVTRRVALEGMQMFGGAGYATEYDMEHIVRKALPTTIYGGASEIQREIIGKTLGL